MVLESVRGRPAAEREVLHVGVGSWHDEGCPHSWKFPCSGVDGNSKNLVWNFSGQVKSVVLVCSENDAVSGKRDVLPTIPGGIDTIPVDVSVRPNTSVSEADSIVSSVEGRTVVHVVFLVVSAIVGKSVLVGEHPVRIWLSAWNGSTLIQES